MKLQEGEEPGLTMRPTSANRSDTPDVPHDRLQFGLRTLLLLPVAVACALALLLGTPSVIAVPCIFCLAVAVPAILTVCIVYGRGNTRVFCIGALFPTGLLLYATGWLVGYSSIEVGLITALDELDHWLEFLGQISAPYRVYAGVSWTLSVLAGLLCIGAKRVVTRAARRSPTAGKTTARTASSPEDD